MKIDKKILLLFLAITIVLTSISFSVFAKKRNYSSPPTAYNVSISGTPFVGETLIGQYTYSDPNGDPEGISKFRWLSCTTQYGTYTEISGATSKTYTLTNNDVGKYIKFEVTPVSTKYPYSGTSILSSAIGPVTAPIINLTLPTVESKKIVLGFTTKYYLTDVSSYNSMINHTNSLDQIATVTYTADAYGNLTGTAPQDQIEYANQNGIKPLALIGNNFSSSIAKSILENSTYRQNFINNVVNVVKNNAYKGVNIDFEGINYTNRDQYSQLIYEIKNVLSPLGYLTTVSVPAKTYDSTTNTWTGAFDYKALGTYADEILIMAYDEHGPWGPPGPIASIEWVKNVVNYAQTVIPKEKILLGLAAYGYDWSSAGNKALSINKAYELASQYGVAIHWDSVSQSPYFYYTDSNGVQHTVWFENSYSIAFKLNLVNETNLFGIGIWRLGLEDQQYWNTINAKLNK